MGFSPRSVPREGSADPEPIPLAPKTTSLTRNRIIPFPWRWGGWQLFSDWPVWATAGIPRQDPSPPPLLGHFANSLQDFPDFLPAAPGCGWGWGRR